VHAGVELPLVLVPAARDLRPLQQLVDEHVLVGLLGESNLLVVGREELLAVRTEGVPGRVTDDKVEAASPSVFGA
jgi:hypothetical protein